MSTLYFRSYIIHMCKLFSSQLSQWVILSSCRLGTPPVGFLYRRLYNRTVSWPDGTSGATRWASLACRGRRRGEGRGGQFSQGPDTMTECPKAMLDITELLSIIMTGEWIIYSRKAVESQVMTEALVAASAERISWFVELVFVRADAWGWNETTVTHSISRAFLPCSGLDPARGKNPTASFL